MRICIIVDDERVFHPNFVYKTYTLLKEKYDIDFIIGLVTKIPNKSNINRYFARNFYKLKIQEILKLCSKHFFYLFLNFVFKRGFKNNYFSVMAVAKDNNLKTFIINNSINNKINIKKIQNFDIDLIISSNSQYFGKEILSIPKYGCINRHSSLLPDYAGLMPVFHAISNNEKKIGVTVHLMNEEIDGGMIISQEIHF